MKIFLVVNSRKEAKHASTVESLSSAVIRIGELKEIVKDQREKKDEYGSIIRQQLQGKLYDNFFRIFLEIIMVYIYIVK